MERFGICSQIKLLTDAQLLQKFDLQAENVLAVNLFEHFRELAARHDAGGNHDQRIWFLINFEMWQRQFINDEKIPAEKSAQIY